MICPNCGKNRFTYLTKRKERPTGGWKDTKRQREDFRAKCPDCGFEGVVK